MPTDAEVDEGAIILAEVDERFRVRDERSASWVVRKVIEERAYRERVAAWYEAETRRSEQREQSLLFRFGGQLADWARGELGRRHGTRRSLHLPGGVVGFRTEPTSIHVIDEKTLIAWCRLHLPSAVKVVESVRKAEISSHIRQSGECPEGAELAGGGEKFYIK